jgi:hypothetical protein
MKDFSFILGIATLVVCSDALISRSRIVYRQTPIGMLSSSGDASFEDNRFDVEAARERLEALIGFDEASSVKDRSFSVSPSRSSAAQAPPLTTIAKERRTAEIHLLKQLEKGDEAVSALWSLWFSEQGPQAEAELQQTDDLMVQGPAMWGEAEDRLRSLVAKHGVHWAEPLNRLATLYYLQKRWKQSRALCELVLSVKPWHFGALSGIVMVCAEMDDLEGATQWAALRLPPIEAIGRRVVWVQRAVETARRSLKQAEERVRLSFGKPDEHIHGQRQAVEEQGDEESAWQ